LVQHSVALTRKAQAYIDPKKRGLEVSPYFDPFVSKSDFKVAYTDYIDTETIRAKAAGNPELRGQDVPEVDFVWHPGRTLAECAPHETRFDYVVASHVMEHVPNPIGWVNELLSTLKIGGHVVLFLPDRRYTSDYYRAETHFYQAVQWWLEQPSVPTPGQVLDFMSTAFSKDHDTVIEKSPDGMPFGTTRPYTDTNAVDFAAFVHKHNNYLDIHCSVWTSSSFGPLFERLVGIDILNVEIVEVVDDEGEFLAVLRKKGEPKRLPPSLPQAVSDVSLDYAAPSGGQANSLTIETQLRALRQDVGSLTRQNDPGLLNAIDHRLKVLHHDMGYLIRQFEDQRKRPWGLRFKIWLKPKIAWIFTK
jgi:SAM-dependent methyltransferase